MKKKKRIPHTPILAYSCINCFHKIYCARNATSTFFCGKFNRRMNNLNFILADQYESYGICLLFHGTNTTPPVAGCGILFSIEKESQVENWSDFVYFFLQSSVV